MIKKGKRGEEIAVKFLKKRGYKIIERNYRTKGGEVDIIAKSPGGDVCFIEVKSEKTPFGGLFKINRLKKEKIKRVALDFISRNRWAERSPLRFDFIWIDLGNEMVIEHIEGGFE